MIGINDTISFKSTYNVAIIAWFILLLMSGCGGSPSAPEEPAAPLQSVRIDGDIELKGQVAWDVSIDSVSANIWVINKGDQNAGIQYGPCSFRLLAYQSDKKGGNPIWHNKLLERFICVDVLEQIKLSPGESKEVVNLGNVSGTHWAIDLPDGNLTFEVMVKRQDGKTLSFPLTGTSL